MAIVRILVFDFSNSSKNILKYLEQNRIKLRADKLRHTESVSFPALFEVFAAVARTQAREKKISSHLQSQL